MKKLHIVWQRLTDDSGATCTRCAGTGAHLAEAVQKLEKSLRILDIQVTLDVRTLSGEAFAAQPQESNRIWLNDKPLEGWLDAESGSSACGGVCGDNACRTVEADGRQYETLPEALLLRAGLIAAAHLLA